MNCQEVMELMQRHVDRDLNEQETSLMMTHVGHCPDCAAMLEKLVNLSRGLEQLPRVVPPYSLVDAILPELGKWDAAAAETAGEPAAPLTPRSRRAARVRSTWIARISGVVALGVVVGLLLVNGPFSGRMGSSQQDAASAPEAAANKEAASMATDGTMYSVEDQSSSVGSPSAKSLPKESADTFKKELSVQATQSEPSASAAADSGAAADAGGAPASGAGSAPSQSPAAADDRIAPASPGNEGGNVNKGLTENPSDPASEPPVTMMGVQAVTEESVSPDGHWKAVLTDGALQVFNADDGSLVYDQVPDYGKRSGLAWSEDSTALNYTYTDAEGKQTQMYLQVPEMKEMAR